MAKHGINLGHHTRFQDTGILAIRSRHMEQIIREAVEIGFHPSDMNRKDGFTLSKSWTLLQTPKACKKTPFLRKSVLPLISTIPEQPFSRYPPYPLLL